jgi:hypothetical protein
MGMDGINPIQPSSSQSPSLSVSSVCSHGLGSEVGSTIRRRREKKGGMVTGYDHLPFPTVCGSICLLMPISILYPFSHYPILTIRGSNLPKTPNIFVYTVSLGPPMCCVGNQRHVYFGRMDSYNSTLNLEQILLHRPGPARLTGRPRGAVSGRGHSFQRGASNLGLILSKHAIAVN